MPALDQEEWARKITQVFLWLVCVCACMSSFNASTSKSTPASKRLDDLVQMYEVVQENSDTLDARSLWEAHQFDHAIVSSR